MPAKVSELSIKIGEYLDFLELERHSSPLTIRNYTHYLNRFLKFILSKIKYPKATDIDKLLIDSYKKDLSKFNLSNRTLGYHLIAIRSFLKWSKSKGVVTLNIEQIEVPKVESSKIDFLSGGDVERLMSAPDLGTVNGKRDRAIMEVFYSTGLRVSELTLLDKGSIDFNKKEIIILSKNKKGKRAIFLSSRAIDWILNYLKTRKDNLKPLFISHKGKLGRLTPRSVQRMIKKYTKKIGLSFDVSPKTLRHAFAIDLLMMGAETKNVQKMLGHKNISTTQIYTHATNKQLRDIHAAFHGKGGN